MLSEARFTIVGHVGSAEVKENGGRRRAEISVAVDDSYTPEGGERVERTNWNRVTTFIPTLVDFVGKWVTKGRYIRVEGEISNRSYERNGEKVYVTDLNATRIDFLDPKRS